MRSIRTLLLQSVRGPVQRNVSWSNQTSNTKRGSKVLPGLSLPSLYPLWLLTTLTPPWSKSQDQWVWPKAQTLIGSPPRRRFHTQVGHESALRWPSRELRVEDTISSWCVMGEDHYSLVRWLGPNASDFALQPCFILLVEITICVDRQPGYAFEIRDCPSEVVDVSIKLRPKSAAQQCYGWRDGICLPVK